MTHIQLHTYILFTLLHLTHTITHIHINILNKTDKQTYGHSSRSSILAHKQIPQSYAILPTQTHHHSLTGPHRQTHTDTHIHAGRVTFTQRQTSAASKINSAAAAVRRRCPGAPRSGGGSGRRSGAAARGGGQGEERRGGIDGESRR